MVAALEISTPAYQRGALPRPLWRRGLAWLLFLGPFFFLTYGLSNQWAATLDFVPSYYTGWERAIPFIPWLMLPYWSIDGFYAASLFVASSRQELDSHARRLVLATLLSCAGFLMFPLRFAFERPEVAGFNGWLLQRLLAFDQPFNQAPSLHVSLLVILWVHYMAHLKGKWKLLLSAWFALIGFSVVGTYQHHLIDVVTGLAAGVLCLYLVPAPAADVGQQSADPRRKLLAFGYGLGAMACAGIWALFVQVGAPWWGLVFAWSALALSLMVMAYGRSGAAVLQKHGGVIAWPARLVLAPCLFGAWISARLQNRGCPAFARVANGLYLGRLPRRGDTAALRAAGITAVLDMTAEFDRAAVTAGLKYENLPVLDLTVPGAAQLRRAAEFINTERAAGGNVLVHCALGLSRSACAAAGAEVAHGRVVEDVVAALRTAEPRVVLYPAHQAALKHLLQ